MLNEKKYIQLIKLHKKIESDVKNYFNTSNKNIFNGNYLDNLKYEKENIENEIRDIEYLIEKENKK